MIPTTLAGCLEALNKKLSPAEQIALMQMRKDELSKTHHGLGQWIRNNWGLWKDGELSEHMKSLGFRHPDDMSSTIIKEYWLHLNKLPSEIDSDLEKYNKHWDKLTKNEEGEYVLKT
jgi:hypothetical protein